MIEVNEAGGTALMTPEEIQRERERREAVQRIKDAQRFEQQKQMWHLFSYTLPIAAFVLGAALVGVVFFVAMKIMSEAWQGWTW